MKICIVDDDKLVALSLKTILEANADIQVCGLGENGKDAIDLFHQYQPDVLLMDIRMSEMTGLENNFSSKILPEKFSCSRLFPMTNISSKP